MRQRPRKIFYHCFDTNARGGGQKHTYQHVDILCAHGFDAYIVHETPGYRLDWFRNQTRVISRQDCDALLDPAQDYVVLAETVGSDIAAYPGRKVIFNKNLYHGFAALENTPDAVDPYVHPDVVAAFAVSEHNAAHLRFAYPRLTVCHVIPGIDLDRFTFRPIEQKQPQIAVIGKATTQLAVLFHTLRARMQAGVNQLGAFSHVVLGTQCEDEVVRVLQESLMLVFLNVQEGLGRLVLEAEACGCLPIAYRAGPLLETLPPGWGIEYGDHIAAVRQIEAIAASWPHDLARWRDVTSAGRAVAQRYSLDRQAQSVVTAWQEILTMSTDRGVRAPSGYRAS
jgi:glycosyltransferase involved in cell wall biosynthesis